MDKKTRKAQEDRRRMKAMKDEWGTKDPDLQGVLRDIQKELDEQAKNAVRRSVGRDAWCIGGEHSTAIESAACALWAAKNAKYKPGRKARIG